MRSREREIREEIVWLKYSCIAYLVVYFIGRTILGVLLAATFTSFYSSVSNKLFFISSQGLFFLPATFHVVTEDKNSRAGQGQPVCNLQLRILQKMFVLEVLLLCCCCWWLR